MIQPSGDGFWATVELLVDGIADGAGADPFKDDIEDWLDTVANKAKIQRVNIKKSVDYSETDAETDCNSLFDSRYIVT